jgi:hypothetical protein
MDKKFFSKLEEFFVHRHIHAYLSLEQEELMEEMQQRPAASPIDRSERSQSYSMPGKRHGDESSPLQEQASPRFGKIVLHSFAGSMWSMDETQPSPISTPLTMLEVNRVSPSLPSSTLEGHPAPAQNASLPEVPETPIQRSLISPALFDGVVDVPEYPRLSVIIPTRNEAANLPYVLPRIPAIIHEVILVDGCSTDGTIEVAQRLLPGIRVIEQRGKGKGDAIRAGLEAATGDIIVLMDADGSADPQEILTFVETLLAGNDFAKGSRFAKGGGSHDITMLRSIGNYGLSRLVNILFGTRFSDLCYGYNAFWKHCLDYVAIDSDGFEIETLINIRMHRAGLKISEVPSFEYQRIHGTSNLNTFRDGWRVLKTILREYKRKRFPAPQPLQVEAAIPDLEYVLEEEIVL